jgi:hypothetical protein
MLVHILGHLILFLPVTAKADPVSGVFKAIAVTAGMRLMAVTASILHQRFMDNVTGHSCHHVLVTGEAQVGSNISQP